MTDEGHLRIERLIRAPIDRVFDAWTDPQSMSKWLSPTGRAEANADVRVGGRFAVVMIGDDMRLEHTGEYLEVDRPRRLSFTWQSPYTGEQSSVVTVDLTEERGGTRLVLVHERLPVDTVDAHRNGWGSILDRLADEVLGTQTQEGTR